MNLYGLLSQDLNQQELELAFKVIDQMMDQYLLGQLEFEIPQELSSLSRQDWQMLASALQILRQEKDNSRVH